jgi:hypothetical protein
MAGFEVTTEVSVEDLPHQVLLMFLESPDNLGWDPSKGPLERFLLGVLKHKLQDHRRRHAHIAGSTDDALFASQIPQLAVEQMPNQLLDADFAKILRCDPELWGLIVAAENIVGGFNRNQQLAQELGKTVRDVVNLKRRLHNRLRDTEWKQYLKLLR